MATVGVKGLSQLSLKDKRHCILCPYFSSSTAII